MVEGRFFGSDKPVIRAGVAWNQAIQQPYFLLDTGFTGELVVPKEVARDLGLQVSSVEKIQLANAKIVEVPAATAIAVMEGRSLLVTVYIADGWPLLGISFMQKFNYRAEIDCKNKTVKLEEAD